MRAAQVGAPDDRQLPPAFVRPRGPGLTLNAQKDRLRRPNRFVLLAAPTAGNRELVEGMFPAGSTPYDPGFVPPGWSATAADARAYRRHRMSSGQRIAWEEFYNRYEQIAVKISKDILESDEAIVAVLAHEMHELNGLRRIFEERGGWLPASELARLINPGHKGNLHDQAWDVADRAVAEMRKKGRS